MSQTYRELYQKAEGWTARHLAKDFLLMWGGAEIASERDVKRVTEAEEFDRAKRKLSLEYEPYQPEVFTMDEYERMNRE